MLVLKCVNGGYITKAKHVPKNELPPLTRPSITSINIRIGKPVSSTAQVIKVYWDSNKVHPAYYFKFNDKYYKAPTYMGSTTDPNAAFNLDNNYAMYEVVSTEPDEAGISEIVLLEFQKEINSTLSPILRIVKQTGRITHTFELELKKTRYAVVDQVVVTDAYIQLIEKTVEKYFFDVTAAFNNTGRIFTLWKKGKENET